jgi:Tfp pilus assembly protein PilV
MRKGSKGQSVIEAMIAVSILTIGFLGISSLLVRSFALSRTTSDDLTATYLASEGIELMKNIIDHDVYAGNAWGTCTNAADLSTCTNSGAYTVDYGSAVPTELGGPNEQCFTNAAVPPLDFDSSTGIYSYSGGTASKFQRCIQLTHNGQEITVNAIVDWSTNGAASTLNLEDHFYNWNPA